MHPKSIATLDTIIENPKIPASEAYMKHHLTTNPNSARVSVHKLLTKPNAQLYLKKHAKKAKETVIEVMNNSSILKDEPAHAAIALRSAQDILDRTYGKATNTSVNTNLNINLEQALNDLL